MAAWRRKQPKALAGLLMREELLSLTRSACGAETAALGSGGRPAASCHPPPPWCCAAALHPGPRRPIAELHLWRDGGCSRPDQRPRAGTAAQQQLTRAHGTGPASGGDLSGRSGPASGWGQRRRLGRATAASCATGPGRKPARLQSSRRHLAGVGTTPKRLLVQRGKASAWAASTLAPSGPLACTAAAG